MEALETFLPSSTRISYSLPSSLDFSKAPLGRPSSFPARLTGATSFEHLLGLAPVGPVES